MIEESFIPGMNKLKRKTYVPVNKDVGVGNMINTLSLDMKVYNSEFAQVGLGFALFQYFLSILSFFLF